MVIFFVSLMATLQYFDGDSFPFSLIDIILNKRKIALSNGLNIFIIV